MTRFVPLISSLFFGAHAVLDRQLYLGWYFGCDRSAACFQIQVLSGTKFKIEAFIDTGKDRVMHYFPSAEYTWNNNDMEISALALGFKYSLPEDLAKNTGSPWHMMFNRDYEGDKLVARFVNSYRIDMMGVLLHFRAEPQSFARLVTQFARDNKWYLSRRNLDFLWTPPDVIYAMKRTAAGFPCYQPSTRGAQWSLPCR
jgi:hypothetical protein